MAKYDIKSLRRDILQTLAYIPFEPVRIKAILNALRPTGYPDLSENWLMAQIKYLEEKKFLKVEKAKNYITEEEIAVATLTAEGMDLLDGNRRDIGVECG